METFMPITYLNDFVFCPYSLYLHRVFDENEEVVYSAMPQQKGKSVHGHVDSRPPKSKGGVLKGIYVISTKLGVYGKIDTFYTENGKLIESKYSIKTLYQGYYYQLWAQYFAMVEMGYQVNEMAFFSIRDRKSFPVKLPEKKEYVELKDHIKEIIQYDFEAKLQVNPAKCTHCIYAALCDKTSTDHVYA